MDYIDNFPAFAGSAAERIASVKARPMLEDNAKQDDLLYMTAIPWVSFTSFMHPIHMHPTDSIARIAWGKFFQGGKSLKMPLGVQAHHALMDGIHMGSFYDSVEGYLQHPGALLSDR